MNPQTRRSGLLTRELPDELVVYDQERHSAHCLNRTAAAIFRNADGTRTLAELARVLDPDAAGPDADSAVRLALEQLEQAGLLEAGSSDAAENRLTRRDVARRFGIAAAILLPAVVTVLAPTPAEAAATCAPTCVAKPVGTTCTCLGEPVCTETCQPDGSCGSQGIC